MLYNHYGISKWRNSGLIWIVFRFFIENFYDKLFIVAASFELHSNFFHRWLIFFLCQLTLTIGESSTNGQPNEVNEVATNGESNEEHDLSVNANLDEILKNATDLSSRAYVSLDGNCFTVTMTRLCHHTFKAFFSCLLFTTWIWLKPSEYSFLFLTHTS